MKVSVLTLLCMLLSIAPLVFPASPDSSKPFGAPAFVSFLGGSGVDSIEAVTFDSNNSLWILGSTTAFDGALTGPTNPSNGAAGDGGFVMKFNPQWQRQLFIRTCSGSKISTPPDGSIWIVCSPNVIHLDASGSTVLGNFTGFSNNTRQVEWISTETNANVYDLVVLDPGPFFAATDSLSRLSGVAGSTERTWNTPIGRGGTQAMTIDRNTNMIYVGGEHTKNTTLEDYKSPFLFRYCLSGVRDQSWFWWDWEGPAVRDKCTTITPTCPDLGSDPRLINNSYVTGLVYSGSRMYVMGASDGVNNVFLKQPFRLDQDQPALSGACYSTPCYGYPSARRNSFFARAKSDYSNLDRQSYMVPYLLRSAIGLNSTYLRNYPVCQCYDINETMATRGPNSFNSFGAAEYSDGGVSYVITWGGASFRGPETPTNAWHFRAGYARQNAHITIMDYQMADIMMATLIQAATAPRDFAFRDGLLAIVGNLLGSELSTTGNNDLKGIPYQWELPVTGNALQPTYGGGTQDGFIYVRCVKDVDSCGVRKSDWVQTSPPANPIVCSAAPSAGGSAVPSVRGVPATTSPTTVGPTANAPVAQSGVPVAADRTSSAIQMQWALISIIVCVTSMLMHSL